MREAVFADECSARPMNDVVEEKHTQQRLLRRVEEVCKPVTVTKFGHRSDRTYNFIFVRTRAIFQGL